MKRKWKDSRGETLVEMMASILIGTLSVALLFSTVSASVNISRRAKTADGVFGKSLNLAEKQMTDSEHPGEPGKKVTVEEKQAGSSSVVSGTAKEVIVNFYGGEGALSFALP